MPNKDDRDKRPTPLGVLARARGLVVAATAFGIGANLLLLTGPLFMLQVYDRVLVTRSAETLAALTVLMTALFVLYGVIEHARGRVLARIGARIVAALDGPTLEAALSRPRSDRSFGRPDIDALHRLLASPVSAALCDLPWTPLFLGAVALLHPTLGLVALAGTMILIAIAVLAQVATARSTAAADSQAARAHGLERALLEAPATLRAAGLATGLRRRWRAEWALLLEAAGRDGDRAGAFGSVARAFRLFLQSALMAAGAYLVLHDTLGPGAMIAASLLLGRALAPLDHAISGWPLIARGIAAWREMAARLAEAPSRPRPHALPVPEATLSVDPVTVTLPGAARPALRLVGFTLPAGQTLGVIGPNGSGKSTLAAVLAGAIMPQAGLVRLGGSALTRYDDEALARHLGYHPQHPLLMTATVAENIARLAPRPDPVRVLAAAEAAGAHAAIMQLAAGYDTPVGPGGTGLSGGQARRIALARAFYGPPRLLILDEPDAGLDAEGERALRAAISRHCARGGSAVILSHRPAIIRDADLVLVLEEGTRRAFGPPAAVLPPHVAVAAPSAGAAG